MTYPTFQLHAKTQNRSRPFLYQSLVLIRLLLVIAGIWIGLSAVIVGALTLGNYTLPPVNPFSTYADLFPGQAASAISGWGFSCDTADAPSYVVLLDKDCRLSLATGLFSRIDVTIVNKTIRQISFMLRENTWRVGDLAQFPDTTNFHVLHNTLFFSWRGNLGIASITSKSGRSSPFRCVWKVALTDMIYPPKPEHK